MSEDTPQYRTSSPSRTKTRRGRPAAADTGDSRGDILTAAEALFAEHGFAATSMRSIADRVGVTPAMIHYYFGSKMELFQAVVEQALAPLAAAIANLRSGSKTMLEQFPGLVMRLAAERPQLPALLMREVFLPGGKLQGHFAVNLAPRLGGALPGLLATEQEAGRISDDFDPRVTALLVLAMCVFPFVARPLAEKALGVRYDAAGVDHLEEHVTMLLKRGLKP